ncbi:unnamed protein product [Rotaria socialis]|uniref:Uncharacterized protein n=1 Tax=Rotaria socialis TaxID=392032 RepID=A0A818BW81_9BILA|nr:unnamed protein product [Rotaria socialis]
MWIFIGVQLTKNQKSNNRLPLSIANCTGTNVTESMITNMTTTITNTKPNPLLDLYSVSHMWYTPIAVGTVLIVGVLVSYLSHPLKSNEIDSKLIIRKNDIRMQLLLWVKAMAKSIG